MATPSNHSADLTDRAQRMDENVYQQWYQEHARRLMAFIQSRCKTKADGEEIFQEMWLRVWKSGTAFDGSNVRAWLFQIARNLIIDASRKRRPELLAGEVSWEEFVVSIVEEEDDRLPVFRDCLKRVGGPFLDVIQGFLSGKKTTEIAVELGIAEGTVSSRKSRGEEEIKQCLKQKLQ